MPAADVPELIATRGRTITLHTIYYLAGDPTRAAVEEGIVAGGGVALLYGQKALENLKPINDDQRRGVDIVRQALTAPVRQIAENAGHRRVPSSVGKLKESTDTNYGFDAQKNEYTDMVKSGIIDPVKVVRSALQFAASVAGLLVTTEAMVAEKPAPEGRADAGRRRHGRHGRHGLLSPVSSRTYVNAKAGGGNPPAFFLLLARLLENGVPWTRSSPAMNALAPDKAAAASAAAPMRAAGCSWRAISARSVPRGAAIYLTLGTVWVVAPFVIHGVLINYLYGGQHELSHSTVFRTRGLNAFWGRVIGFIVIAPRDADQIQRFRPSPPYPSSGTRTASCSATASRCAPT